MKNITKENISKGIDNIVDICIDNSNKNQAWKSIKILENQISRNPHPKFFFTLGNIYLAQGNAEKSIEFLLKASELAPNIAEIFNNLSNAYLSMNDYDQAKTSAMESIKINNCFPEAWVTLANINLKLEKTTAAIEALDKALKLNPKMYAALINLGNIYFDINKLDQSRELFEKAIKINSASIEAYNGLGLILNKLGKIDEAIKNFNIAIQIDSKNINVLGNLAAAHTKNDNSEEAIILYRNALAYEPNNIDLLTNFAFVLQTIGRSVEANLNFKRAFSLNTKNNSLIPYLIHSELELCNWENYNSNMDTLLTLANNNSQEVIPPFALANSLANPQTRFNVARRYSINIEKNISSNKKIFNHINKKNRLNTKLRIGYISPDLRDHSLGQSFQAIIKSHNKDKYDIHGFSTRITNDKLSNVIKSYFGNFHNISYKSAIEAAKTIYEQKIDVLIDLAGHTKNNSLEILAFRPAPVQAHYLGYGSTIGSDNIDWLITDNVHTPIELYKFCSESLILLPNSFMSAEYLKIKNINVSRKNENLPQKSIVFANFNSTSKFDPKSFKCWMKILKNVPKSVLWLKQTSDLTEKNLVKEAEMLGIAANRLIFAERKSRIEHIARLGLADICFDTFLHNGGVTTIDALNAGVPVISLKGTNHTERTGASILSAAGLHECIKINESEYTKFCIDLGLQKPMINELKKKIKDIVPKSALFDNHLISKNLESSYEKMFKYWKNNNKPEFIQI